MEATLTKEQVRDLSYFDLWAYAGDGSLHCGGLEATYRLLQLASAMPSSRVLEIGCGPGTTSSALLACGVDLTVLEPSATMLRTALHRCTRLAGRSPTAFNVAVEHAEWVLYGQRFGIVLLECVFGFVGDKRKAIEVIKRAVGPGGRVAVIDYSYCRHPPSAIVARLDEIGVHEILFRKDWEGYFQDFQLVDWLTLDNAAPQFELTAIEAALRRGPFPIKENELGEISLAIYARLLSYENWFAENRNYMAPHLAVWKA